MSHDKTRAAAHKRMAETGEPYTAARRAAVSEHQSAGTGSPPSGARYALRMSDEIHDWLAGLRGSDESAALRVAKALVALMREGASLGAPLVVSTAGPWPWALGVALDRAYHERLERLAALRGGEADAATLVRDLEDQLAELAATQAELAEIHRRALDAGTPQEAAQAAEKLTVVQQQAAEARRLLPRMTEARDRLGRRNRQLQTHVEADRVRKEALRARYAATRGSLQAREAMAALGLADDDGDGDRHPEASGEAASADGARLAEVTAQMERELGQQPRPEGLMELWPGAPWHEDIRILFAAEPPGTALLAPAGRGGGRRASRHRAADRRAGGTRSGGGAVPRSGHGGCGRAAPGQGWPGARSSHARLRRPTVVPGGVLSRHRRRRGGSPGFLILMTCTAQCRTKLQDHGTTGGGACRGVADAILGIVRSD
jgi:hypothetical protein